ncbi:MAG: hypothetical protein KF693_17480 [Nitrospira sp.]|nr:hypothetical protein [Nitrospira sp.]
MRLMVASLLFLILIVYARYRGSFSACHFDLRSIGNPVETGNFFSLKGLGNEAGRTGARPVLTLPLSLSVPRMIRYFVIARSLQDHHGNASE